MPKKIDPKVKERCTRQVLEHLPEYPSLTAAAEAVALREVLGKETVRRWVVQAQIDGGQRLGATSAEWGEDIQQVRLGRRTEDVAPFEQVHYTGKEQPDMFDPSTWSHHAEPIEIDREPRSL